MPTYQLGKLEGWGSSANWSIKAKTTCRLSLFVYYLFFFSSNICWVLSHSQRWFKHFEWVLTCTCAQVFAVFSIVAQYILKRTRTLANSALTLTQLLYLPTVYVRTVTFTNVRKNRAINHTSGRKKLLITFVLWHLLKEDWLILYIIIAFVNVKLKNIHTYIINVTFYMFFCCWNI